MIGYSDDTKMLELLAPLRWLEPVPFVAREPGGKDRLRRPILVAAIVFVALALTGVAIADGVGAFDGISAAQHPQTSADALDPQAAAWLHALCLGNPSEADSFCQLDLGSVRLVRTLPSSDKVYVLTDTHGDLCVLVGGGGLSCGPGLDSAQPITAGGTNDTGDEFFAYGVAMDGVASVSFTVGRGGKQVTVPVQDNVYAYEQQSTASEARCVTAHFADGSTVDPFPEACP